MTGGHNDDLAPERRDGRLAATQYPGMPSGVCDGVDGVTREGARGDPRRGRRDQDRLLRRLLLPGRRSDSSRNFSQEEVDAIVRTAADQGTWVMSHAHGARGHQARGAGGRPLDRPRHVPGPGGRGDDGRARHLARAHAHGRRHHRGARRRSSSCPPPCARSSAGSGRPEFDAFRLAAEAGVKVAMGTDCPVAPARHEPQRAAAHGRTRVHARSRRCIAARPRAPPS